MQRSKRSPSEFGPITWLWVHGSFMDRFMIAAFFTTLLVVVYSGLVHAAKMDEEYLRANDARVEAKIAELERGAR